MNYSGDQISIILKAKTNHPFNNIHFFVNFLFLCKREKCQLSLTTLNYSRFAMPLLPNTPLFPSEAVHPGEILADELDTRDISQLDFAKIIGISKTQLNELIKGKRDFSSELCLFVAKALDMDTEIWLNLKNNYELEKAFLSGKTKKRLQEIDNRIKLRN
ncbi:MAG TPA: addiction module antidote protein, HigA family [Bacteroidetes bacterium]|nr:addiction module antidote protein, HigA family [Bacteroidota bacterium]